MNGYVIVALLLVSIPPSTNADETLLTIQQVRGEQSTVVEVAGRHGGGATTSGRGRSGGATVDQALVLKVPAEARITTAIQEHPTLEVRVGGEFA